MLENVEPLIGEFGTYVELIFPRVDEENETLVFNVPAQVTEEGEVIV